VVQNPLHLGYLGGVTAVKHLGGEKVDKRIDTGVVLVTPENMNEPQIKDLLYPPLSQYLN
jgi:ribose transport system substrate-binding protein